MEENIRKKIVQMLNSSDAEMNDLGLCMMSQHIKYIDDYYSIRGDLPWGLNLRLCWHLCDKIKAIIRDRNLKWK